MKVTIEMLKLNKLLGENEQSIVRTCDMSEKEKSKMFAFFCPWLRIHRKNVNSDYCFEKARHHAPSCHLLAFCISEYTEGGFKMNTMFLEVIFGPKLLTLFCSVGIRL